MVQAALAGELDNVETRVDPVFGLAVPRQVDGVPEGVLDPRATWPDVDAYDRAARDLARMFSDNFDRYADSASEAIRNAGPVDELAAAGG
jgi:phosphoenolpyruvate carboxykinase (ATP)